MIGVRNRRVLDDRGEAVRNRRLGIVGVFAIVVALVTTGLAYVNPADQAGYTAHSATSGGVRVGDEIRVAGVPVGKVTGVRLSRTLVEMTFDVDRSVAIGSDTTLDIRLLTPSAVITSLSIRRAVFRWVTTSFRRSASRRRSRATTSSSR